MAVSNHTPNSDAALRRRNKSNTKASIIRVWFDRDGASQDPPMPWLVERSDGTVARLSDVTISGTYEGRFNANGEASLIGGPKAYLELKLDESWKDR